MRYFGHRRNRAEGHGGAFTLIELMIALAMMSLIVFALFSMFGQTQKALRSNITQSDVMEAGRAAMEMMARELEEMTPSRIPGRTNFFAALSYRTTPYGDESLILRNPVIQRLGDNTPPQTQTHVLQEFFFLSSLGKTWTGTGYRVIGSGHGVGTLYRFSVSTDSIEFQRNPNRMVSTFMDEPLTNRVNNRPSPNLARLADGIVHMRVQPYDASGRPLTFDNQVTHPVYRILRQDSRGGKLGQFSTAESDAEANVILRQENRSSNLPWRNETQFFFLGEAVPAYLELELAVLEPEALKRYEALRDGPPSVAQNYLEQQSHRVHLFRQRIPIRTAER